MKTTRYLGNVLMTLLLVISIAACGGGSDDTRAPSTATQPPPSNTPSPSNTAPVLPAAPTSPSPAPTSASPYYLATGTAGASVAGATSHAAGAIQFSSGHLVVVDPASPTTPVALEAAGWWQQLAQFEEGVIDSAMGTVSGLGTRFLVYLKDGRVYRLDLRRGNWPPVPGQTSSLATMQTCFVHARPIPDRRSSEKSLLLFTNPGPDQLCDSPDDRQVAVRLDMSPNDSPLAINGEVSDAVRSADGAITGFLVRDGNRVQRVDAGFANPFELFTVSGADFELAHPLNLAQTLQGHIVFRDGAAIRAYDFASGGIPVTLMTLDSGDYYVSSHAADSSAIYIALSKRQDDGGQLIRVGADLSTEVLATENTSILETFVSPMRIVYGAGSVGYPWDGGTYEYRSVPKSGGTPITLASDPLSVIGGAFVSGENVWVRLLRHTGTSAGNWINVVRSDGLELQQFLQATIIGHTLPNPASLLPEKSTIHSITIAHDLSPSAGAFSSATLRSYDGATRAELVEYGSVPSGGLLSVFAARNPQSGMPGLLSTQAASSGGRPAPLDVFFYQSNASGLTRVTKFAP